MEAVNKKYVMIFSFTFIGCLMVIIVALVFLLPKQHSTASTTMYIYEAVSKSEFSYQSTKDIEENELVRNYTINSDQIANFKRKNQYVVGNSDPFTPYSELVEEDEDGKNTSTSGGASTTDKITNSNGGIANPPSTNK